MRGRKPKPTHLRVIEGNPGHRPINHDEPEPDGDVSKEPPEFLSARAQYYWRKTIGDAPEGMIKATDNGIFMGYCIACADFEEATIKVNEAGPVIRIPGQAGFQQNPFVSIKRNAFERLTRSAAELGLTPSSRTRVKIKGKKKPNSILGKLRTLDL